MYVHKVYISRAYIGIFRKFTHGKASHWSHDLLSGSSILESVAAMLYQSWRCCLWKNDATKWQTNDRRTMQWIDGHCNCEPNACEFCWPISVAINDLYLELLSECKANVSEDSPGGFNLPILDQIYVLLNESESLIFLDFRYCWAIKDLWNWENREN